jgi:hypothetical protein
MGSGEERSQAMFDLDQFTADCRAALQDRAKKKRKSQARILN